jgi:hypothetical protein
MMRLLHLYLGLAILTGTSCAGATSRCPVEGGCVDEASAALLSPVDALLQHCSDADPARKTDYEAAANSMLRKEDANFLKRLRASAVYATMRSEVDAKMKEMDKQALLAVCEKFLAQH